MAIPLYKAPASPASNRQAVQLNSEEMDQARQLATTINFDDPSKIQSFGNDVSEHAGALTDSLLERIRSNDKDIIGDQLNQIVRLARDTHSHMAFQKESWKHAVIRGTQKLPVVGPVARFVGRKYLDAQEGFKTASEQIDAVTTELQCSVNSLQETNEVFNQMYGEVSDQIRLLQIRIEAAQIALAEAHTKAEGLRNQPEHTELEIERLRDLDAAISSMEKRVADLRVLQQQAVQTLPSIRMIQTNNVQLVEKFATIRDVTIPAWKQGFVIRGALTQQQHGVHLTQAIDDATNQLLLDNSQLLHANSVETAKANQRLVIDVDTLKKTSDQMFQTAQEVMRIRQEGRSTRDAALAQLEALQQRTNQLSLQKPKSKALH